LALDANRRRPRRARAGSKKTAPHPILPAGALELLAAGAGIERAITDDPVGRGPWIPSDFGLRGFIERLRDAGALEVQYMARPIRRATDGERSRASPRTPEQPVVRNDSGEPPVSAVFPIAPSWEPVPTNCRRVEAEEQTTTQGA
jgi:hypothetical protein